MDAGVEGACRADAVLVCASAGGSRVNSLYTPMVNSRTRLRHRDCDDAEGGAHSEEKWTGESV